MHNERKWEEYVCSTWVCDAAEFDARLSDLDVYCRGFLFNGSLWCKHL